ncbi:hypothetical protein PHYPO_G00168890 [Pangasianodon hypophthalmus]|uniref:Uncharacterized protein n=1 Tax=Pangasianodon hypophthalmus TaxID=310915 RepID=A0A5N5JEH7_PANHP|nr:hypothetical protein PHYPO_G00168890 [Pangasianodon hypophthalmus]
MAESDKKTKKSKEERAKAFCSNAFAHNAFFLFNKATEIVKDYGSSTQMKQILDQMLHSILFLGNIHFSRYLPHYIFADVEMFHQTSEDFPGPFTHYQTHVALRTPFSYFLELVTICYGHDENDKEVESTLSEILHDCRKSGDQYPLISTVICICESGGSRYYGASLSCEGDQEREIMTAVSCVHVWHLKVSSAVMSVFPEDTGEPRSIKLPDTVKCRAYAVADMRKLKPPCKRCNQLYSLPDHTNHSNPPGNCAETEAISNFFNAENHGNSRQTLFRHNHQEEMQRMSKCFDNNMEKRMERRSVRNRDKYSINKVYNS